MTAKKETTTKKRSKKTKESDNVKSTESILPVEENISIQNVEPSIIEETTIQESTIVIEEPHQNITININMEEKDVTENNITSLKTDTIEEDKPMNKVLSDSSIKKRGRKPKGGKIVQQLLSNQNNKENKVNIILHLKCSLKDLQNNEDQPIEYYNFISDLNYEILKNKSTIPKNDSCDFGFYENNTPNINFMNDLNGTDNTSKKNTSHNETDHLKSDKKAKNELWNKLKQLQNDLHINNLSDKKSACFWCTHHFDNPPIYIPKHYINNIYHVYGCFCSPECGVAFLMEENVDHSVKFERYHLLNHIYSKIYDYTRNIKPAPKPHYLLEKFYGNLTIQEYRSLLQNERLFLVVDKPLTRILPELHEDNDDFIINHKVIPSSYGYQVNKKMSKTEKTNSMYANHLE